MWKYTIGAPWSKIVYFYIRGIVVSLPNGSLSTANGIRRSKCAQYLVWLPMCAGMPASKGNAATACSTTVILTGTVSVCRIVLVLVRADQPPNSEMRHDLIRMVVRARPRQRDDCGARWRLGPRWGEGRGWVDVANRSALDGPGAGRRVVCFCGHRNGFWHDDTTKVGFVKRGTANGEMSEWASGRMSE
jgi:hypothetical protein